MRITHAQKSELSKIILASGLTESNFEFAGQDDVYQVKFNDDYFLFLIQKINPTDYVCTVTYINNKIPQEIKRTWEQTVEQFEYWIRGIAEDVKHKPNLFKVASIEFPDEIKKYSKSFVEIYRQALSAETNGLTEICGLGYRKAFEFLIKDFLLRKHPKTEHQSIKELQITPCITKYVTNEEIKLVAYRVLWLGNDHAHYLKKWKGKTLADLKNLIELTIKWIMISDELKKVEKSMPKN